jgi:uncharacterized membrane protein
MFAYAMRYGAVLGALAIGDALWLGWFGQTVVRPALGATMRDSLAWTPVVLFYLLYAIGVVIFAVDPGLRAGSSLRALALGALFGFMAYMTYDMTNMATLKAWTFKLLVMDIAWGTFITGLSSVVSAWVSRGLAS